MHHRARELVPILCHGKRIVVPSSRARGARRAPRSPRTVRESTVFHSISVEINERTGSHCRQIDGVSRGAVERPERRREKTVRAAEDQRGSRSGSRSAELRHPRSSPFSQLFGWQINESRHYHGSFFTTGRRATDRRGTISRDSASRIRGGSAKRMGNSGGTIWERTDRRSVSLLRGMVLTVVSLQQVILGHFLSRAVPPPEPSHFPRGRLAA